MARKKSNRHRIFRVDRVQLSTTLEKQSVKKSYKNLLKSEEAFLLTETDRLIKVYKKDKGGNIYEITCVSLDIKIQGEWVTVIYYDNFHDGMLHRHLRVSISDGSDAPTTIGVKKNGSQNRLLAWAIKDITANYHNYKRNFFKRSKVSFKESIDMQYK